MAPDGPLWYLSFGSPRPLATKDCYTCSQTPIHPALMPSLVAMTPEMSLKDKRHAMLPYCQTLNTTMSSAEHSPPERSHRAEPASQTLVSRPRSPRNLKVCVSSSSAAHSTPIIKCHQQSRRSGGWALVRMRNFSLSLSANRAPWCLASLSASTGSASASLPCARICLSASICSSAVACRSLLMSKIRDSRLRCVVVVASSPSNARGGGRESRWLLADSPFVFPLGGWRSSRL